MHMAPTASIHQLIIFFIIILQSSISLDCPPKSDASKPSLQSLNPLVNEELSKEPFLWGVATAAYQTEGATNVGGRGESIWDRYTKLQPSRIRNGDTGDVADGSYYKWKDDIALIKEMGLNAYRFSISWSRIIPDGSGEINLEGISHYNEVIDELLRNNIEPLVTLYHWDLPQALEDKYNGWLDPQIETDFARYADVCFSSFGDRVKRWITLNEPWTFVTMGYVFGIFAPGRCSDRSRCKAGNSSTEGYIAAHNALNAHAAAVEVYRSKYQAQQRGLIGITLNQDWAEPFTNDIRDIQAAERRNQFSIGWFADPITFGTYPPYMIQRVGGANGRLPQFTESQSKRLAGSYDFFALNHYSSKYFRDTYHLLPGQYNRSFEGWAADQGNMESKYDWNGQLIGVQAASPWLHVVPWGIYKTLKWNSERYTVNGIPPVIYITENGCDVPGEASMSIEEAMNDQFRINYYSSYLEQVDKAMQEGVNVRGYFAWSLLDNFEWADGYSFRFGLYFVDYNDPTLKRYPKKSSEWFKTYAQAHRLYGQASVTSKAEGDMGEEKDPFLKSYLEKGPRWLQILLQSLNVGTAGYFIGLI